MKSSLSILSDNEYVELMYFSEDKQAYMYVQGREVKWKRKTQEKQCTLRHLRTQLQLGRLP
jgi:hypothetical protein